MENNPVKIVSTKERKTTTANRRKYKPSTSKGELVVSVIGKEKTTEIGPKRASTIMQPKSHSTIVMSQTPTHLAASISTSQPQCNELLCDICCNKLIFVAIGHCHCQLNICSLCALRIRLKNKEFHCSICKQITPYMIVYYVKLGQKNFRSFNIEFDLDLITPVSILFLFSFFSSLSHFLNSCCCDIPYRVFKSNGTADYSSSIAKVISIK